MPRQELEEIIANELEEVISDDVVWGKTYYEAKAVNRLLEKLYTRIDVLEELLKSQCRIGALEDILKR